MNLKAERLNRGLSIAELAKQLDISPQALRNIEARRNVPRPGTAKAIADLYGCDVTDIWPVDTDERAAA